MAVISSVLVIWPLAARISQQKKLIVRLGVALGTVMLTGTVGAMIQSLVMSHLHLRF